MTGMYKCHKLSTLFFRLDTFFHKNIKDSDARISVKCIALPDQQEMGTLCRIMRLTGVVLDKRVLVQEGNIPVYTFLTDPDQPEAKLARRTLYE